MKLTCVRGDGGTIGLVQHFISHYKGFSSEFSAPWKLCRKKSSFQNQRICRSRSERWEEYWGRLCFLPSESFRTAAISRFRATWPKMEVEMLDLMCMGAARRRWVGAGTSKPTDRSQRACLRSIVWCYSRPVRNYCRESIHKAIHKKYDVIG